MTAPTRHRPLLIYDGDCSFCAYSVRYWQRLTGERVEYQPWQSVAHQFPDIPPEDFREAIRFVDPDGRVCSGAAAAFRTLQLAPGRRAWLWLYRKLPGFAALSEAVYAFIARHRPLCHRLSQLAWGRERIPPRYDAVSGSFLRLLALIYLAAFASFGLQASGLIGSEGIMPLTNLLELARTQLGVERYWYFPTVLWLDSSDAAIQAVASFGVLAAIALALNLAPRLALVVLYLLYLSLFHAGQIFMGYQWDVLLLEVGFLAIFLPGRQRLVVWLYRLAVFRFMFLSGAVKLLSNDASWADLTALSFHFETQPLPTVLAWYAHHLPEWLLQLAVALTFLIELVLPFFIFLPRRLRLAAAWCFVALQVLIILTGNYNFFNLLTLAMCLFLFDDAALRTLVPRAWRRQADADTAAPLSSRPAGPLATAGRRMLTGLLATFVVGLGLVQTVVPFTGRPPPRPLIWLAGIASPLHAVNRYGLFAAMTTRRLEIVVEGSRDGETWLAYEFKYKPGDMSRTPGWLIPHQPRLDWQMWFAALGRYPDNQWFQNFAVRLLTHSPTVVALLEHNPFAEEPPTHVRARLYRYTFSTAAVRAATGNWWQREPAGEYMPEIRLRISTN